MESYHFLVVGVVRNCAGTVEEDVKNIEKSFCCASEVKFFLVESDSTDNTKTVLEWLKQCRRNFDYVALGELAENYPERTERIAFCRNHYLSELGKKQNVHIDYVVIADFDGINKSLTAERIRSCWQRHDWDVCCANQLGPYYDVWALRQKLWSPNDCWKAKRFLEEHGAGRFGATMSAVYSRMITISMDSDWVEVESAFGGFAIYKKTCLDNVSYIGLDDEEEEVCEHVSLHQEIRETGGRISGKIEGSEICS